MNKPCFIIYCLLVLLIPLRNIVLKIDNLFFIDIPYINTTNILFLLLTLCAVIFKPAYQHKSYYRNKVDLPIIIYCIYFFIQIFANKLEYPSDLIILWKDRFLFPCLLYFISRSIITSKKEVFTILGIMVIANIYMSTYFYRWIRWLNIDTFVDKIKKVNGTFGDIGGSNEWAAFFSTYFFIYLSLLSYLRGKIKRFIEVVNVGNILVLLFTFSRGSYLAFVVGNMWYGLMQRKYKILLAILTVALFYNAVLPRPVIERIQMTFQENESNTLQDKDVISRLNMWNRVIEDFPKSPVFGFGLHTFRYAHFQNPHNQYLHFLYQGGILGLGLFVWLLIAVFQDSRHLYKTTTDPFAKALGLGMCAAIISLAVANVFGDRWTYLPIIGYFWIINGIISSFNQGKLVIETSE